MIYMKHPPGYEQGNKVCLLKKSLYGLKQSPRQWYRRFDEYMLSNGFKRSSYDSCVYYRSYAPGEYIYLLLYVDDMLIACKSKAEIGSTKSLLKKEFDMKELGEAKKILGMEIVRDRSRKILRVSQSWICSVRDCDVERISKVPYANAIGSLMYLMVCTRPDIAYVDLASGACNMDKGASSYLNHSVTSLSENFSTCILNTSAKQARAKPDRYSGEAGMSKDMLADKPKDNTLTGRVPGQDVALRYLHGYGVCRQSEYAVLGIGQTRFLVKSWRKYVVSLKLDMAYW
ncbi:retrotransposon protein, putative, ty1-copia subclass [Tanacetum coccineum]